MDAIYLIAAFAFFVTAGIYGLLTYLVWHKRVKSEQDWVFLVITRNIPLSDQLSGSLFGPFFDPALLGVEPTLGHRGATMGAFGTELFRHPPGALPFVCLPPPPP